MVVLHTIRVVQMLKLLLLCSVILFASCRGGDDNVMIMLPQAASFGKEEKNLSCILEVLREIDYQRGPNKLAALDGLEKYMTPGIDKNVDLNTLLLQYYNLRDIEDKTIGYKFEPRKMISDCKLNLIPAIKRCQNAYSDKLVCKQVTYGTGKYNKAPFVTPNCPEGFQRFGSSKCLRKCNYTESILADDKVGEDPSYQSEWTKTNYCLKAKSYKSEVKKLNGTEAQSIGVGLDNFQMVETTEDTFVYVRNCFTDFKRVGFNLCVATCPLGWYDFSDRCIKKGEMIFFPFVWTPGDGNMVEMRVKGGGKVMKITTSIPSSSAAKKSKKRELIEKNQELRKLINKNAYLKDLIMKKAD